MARGNLTRWLIGGAAVFAGVFVLAAALLTVRKEHQIPDEISAAAWEKEASEASGPAEERFAPPGGPGDAADISDMPTYTRWKTFRTTDGLPSNKAFCVRADGERVWVGTDAGLACYSGGRWLTYGVQDGLPYPVVLSLDVSPERGTCGLARWAGWRASREAASTYSGKRTAVFQTIPSTMWNAIRTRIMSGRPLPWERAA